MTQFDRNKTLEQIEGEDWGEPTYPSSLVVTCHQLRRKALREFTDGDLQTMIGQNIGLPYLIPMALERLRRNPLREGDYYPGDLLGAVLRVNPAFWANHPDLRAEIDSIAQKARSQVSRRRKAGPVASKALTEAYEVFQGARPLGNPVARKTRDGLVQK